MCEYLLKFFLNLRLVCDSWEGSISRSQDEKKVKVSEKKSPSYFFFCVIYGNSPWQSGAMNRIWWSQGYRANEKPPIMKDVLLTSGSTGIRVFRTGVCGFFFSRPSVAPKTMKPFIKRSRCHRRWLVVTSNISFHVWRSRYSITLRREAPAVNGFYT